MPIDPKQLGIIVEAETKNCTIEIYVNGIPVGLCGVGTSRKMARPVHEFLIDGDNELAVLINPGDTPSTAKRPSEGTRAAEGAQPPSSPELDAFNNQDDDISEEERELYGGSDDDGDSPPSQSQEGDAQPTQISGLTDRDFRLKSTAAVENGDEPDDEHEGLPVDEGAIFVARISKYAVGAMSMDGSGEPMIEVAWRAADEQDKLSEARVPFPRWIRGTKDLGVMFGPFDWQEAPQLMLDDAATGTLRATVKEIINAFEACDAGRILGAYGNRFAEVTKAYGLSEKDRVGMLTNFLAGQKGDPEWLFETPDEEDFDFRLVAGGRLVECLGPDWTPVVRQLPDAEDNRFLFPMLLGQSNGKWVIMR